MTVSIRHCKEFIVLAEQLNFTKAAHLLGTTQPVLSKHVALIERELGATLIDRSGSRLELTPSGARFLEGCAAIAQAYDMALGDIGKPQFRRPYSLELTGPFIFPNIVRQLHSVISACRTEHELDVTMTAEAPMSYLDVLREGKADIAFEILSGKSPLVQFAFQKVQRSHIVIATRKGHPLQRFGSDISITALNGAVIYAPDGPIHRSARQRFLHLCERHGVSVRLHVHRCGPFDLRLDQLGNDVAMLTESVLDYYDAPEIQMQRLQEEDCHFDLYAYWDRDTTNPAVPLFVAHLHKLAE